MQKKIEIKYGYDPEREIKAVNFFSSNGFIRKIVLNIEIKREREREREKSLRNIEIMRWTGNLRNGDALSHLADFLPDRISPGPMEAVEC